jgi:hypothetical protein
MPLCSSRRRHNKTMIMGAKALVLGAALARLARKTIEIIETKLAIP